MVWLRAPLVVQRRAAGVHEHAQSLMWLHTLLVAHIPYTGSRRRAVPLQDPPLTPHTIMYVHTLSQITSLHKMSRSLMCLRAPLVVQHRAAGVHELHVVLECRQALRDGLRGRGEPHQGLKLTVYSIIYLLYYLLRYTVYCIIYLLMRRLSRTERITHHSTMKACLGRCYVGRHNLLTH